MTTPVLGLTEWAAAQASPWTPHNSALRTLEQGAMWFRFKDRDLATPPGSPAEGDCYLVAASATGAWAGHDGDITYYVNGAWSFIDPLEGMGAGVLDEDIAVAFLGGSWVELATGTVGAAATQTGEMIAGFIASPSDKDYRIVVKMAHGGTITETTTISAAGTCTATFKTNSTALGGTANSVSTSEQSQSHSSSNTFSAGDDLVLTVSSNSSCEDMSFSIKYTRTLD